MAEAELSPASTANVVSGFSERFNVLMDRAGVSKPNRLSIGSKRFKVALNTFKSWCLQDRIPQTHADRVAVVEDLLKDIPGRYDTMAVVAWLLAGSAVPNPFERDVGELALVDLGLQIAQLAHKAGVDFQGLPREVRSLIIRRTRERLAEINPDPSVTSLDDATAAMVVGMLETARAMT
jgi:hypothetical protein